LEVSLAAREAVGYARHAINQHWFVAGNVGAGEFMEGIVKSVAGAAICWGISAETQQVDDCDPAQQAAGQ
jgi:hypothetical protein